MTHALMEIQAGWVVYTSDGHEIGKVTRLDPQTMWVKKGGMFSREQEDPPRRLVREVETGRVELDITKAEM